MILREPFPARPRESSFRHGILSNLQRDVGLGYDARLYTVVASIYYVFHSLPHMHELMSQFQKRDTLVTVPPKLYWQGIHTMRNESTQEM